MRRLELAGGRLARLNEYGSGPSTSMADGIGPIRLWPGGVMVGRAIGDRDVGGILLPNPNIRQVGSGLERQGRAGSPALAASQQASRRSDTTPPSTHCLAPDPSLWLAS